MEFPIKYDTSTPGWSIVYRKVTDFNFQKRVFLPLKIDFILENSADPDEMPHNAAFHLGFHCLK